ncbi:MAG TPA: tol-pal system protein YbgF [Bryobacteraceae bacterium]|jgi:tol-pal system protein YbgF|nr:tol-pal system protein YbgF [Bryobacteraceae bacterium]
MRVLRLAVLGLACSIFAFAASKEMIELQRDVALLQQKVDDMQRDLDTKLGQLTAMVQQVQDTSSKTTGQIQDALNSGIGKQLAPVGELNTHVEAVGDDVRTLKETINDLNARLERMDAKITDLKNQLQIMQNPPAAPGPAAPGSTAPGNPDSNAPGAQPQAQGGPAPAGMTLEKTYTDARRDLQTGNLDLATQEFQQILKYYPDSELAANAQYYLGEISYNKGDYNGAIQSFDAVLERYPQNPKTADAHLMKALALQRSGQRTRAIQEYKVLIAQYPKTDDARKAQAALRGLGVTSTTAPKAH